MIDFKNPKPPFRPANKMQEEALLKIQRAVCNSQFMEQHKFYFVAEDFKIYTAVLMFLEGVRTLLFRNDKQTISIGDIIVISKSTYLNGKSEKMGSINAINSLGPIGLRIVEQGVAGYEDVLMSDPVMMSDMRAAQTIGAKRLQDYGIGLNIDNYELYHLAIIFFIFFITTIKEYGENPDIPSSWDLPLDSYMNGAFVRNKDGSVDVKVLRGPAFKLQVKSDFRTEIETV